MLVMLISVGISMNTYVQSKSNVRHQAEDLTQPQIQAGYRFLMNNYQEGDKVLIFGFSRGAYTARCVAGMLDKVSVMSSIQFGGCRILIIFVLRAKVGLLPKSNEVQITFAYQCYIDTSSCAGDNAQGFKTTFSRPVEIEFLGVW